MGFTGLEHRRRSAQRCAHWRAAWTLAVVATAACARRDAPERRATDTAAPDVATQAPEPERPFRPGIRFDPATLRPGARVGELVADSVAARRALVDGTWVGTARFRGELTLSGRTFAHPDSEVQAVCFEADSTSAARMPRWAGDERRPWFCFSDMERAARALAPPRVERGATVVVDRFTIHRGLSDEVNAARLVRVVAREGVPPSR